MQIFGTIFFVGLDFSLFEKRGRGLPLLKKYSKMEKKTVFLSYDLGFKGDYPGLYTFLDKHEAKECGNGLAVFEFPISEDDFISELKNEIESVAHLEKSDRLYIIWRDETTGKVKGKFLQGNRTRAPWEGYAHVSSILEDVVQ